MNPLRISSYTQSYIQIVTVRTHLIHVPYTYQAHTCTHIKHIPFKSKCHSKTCADSHICIPNKQHSTCHTSEHNRDNIPVHCIALHCIASSNFTLHGIVHYLALRCMTLHCTNYTALYITVTLHASYYRHAYAYRHTCIHTGRFPVS